MTLTPSEGAMKLLLGQQFPRSGCSSMKECLCRGRELLCRITGKDFRYDPQKWHDHLIATDEGGYTLNGHHPDFERRIAELASDSEWVEARDYLNELPDPPSPPADAPDPEFDLGEKVEVILSDSNKTYRIGWIRLQIWHFKRREWMYYLETKQDGRVKKRYFGSDVRQVGRPNTTSSEQGGAEQPATRSEPE